MSIIAPPFTHESAIQKVRLAEDGCNTRDPEKGSLAYGLMHGQSSNETATPGSVALHRDR
jgi:nuclear transport factor 2 (NTF2) superfamily protein